VTVAGHATALDRVRDQLVGRHTIVRATQCFELVKGITDAATINNVVRRPPVLFQPMAADERRRDSRASLCRNQ
jgi:hypothetical protein